MFNWGWIEGEFNSHRIESGNWWVNNKQDIMKLYEYEFEINIVYNDNKIVISGAYSIGKGLKLNSTLTSLKLAMRSQWTIWGNEIKWDKMSMDWKLIVYIMKTKLGIQEHVQLQKHWRWIQLSQNWIWQWGVNESYDEMR